jgi:hypothetical protein
MRRALPVVLALAAVSAPHPHARAQDDGAAELDARPTPARHCAGTGERRWVMHQLFAAQTNPEGGLNTLRIGPCFPLITTPNVLFDYTNIEVGAVNELSPAFSHFGGYAQITPISPLQLRVELTGLVYWALGLDRAGYYAVRDDDARFSADDLPADEARGATGLNANFLATLRLRVPLHPKLAFIGLSILTLGYWRLGEGEHYLNLRWDAIMAREDWILANEAFFGFETPLTPDFSLRYGGSSSYRLVPASGYAAHQLALFVMGYWPRASAAVLELSPFLRAGYYVEHAFRGDSFSVLLGVTMQYDLGAI